MKLLVLAVLPCAIAVAASGIGARQARADATGLAIIACENLAPYLDGDPNDATTPADEQAACLDPIPPTGTLSISALEQAVGDGNGKLTHTEMLELDALDHNRIDQSCTYDAVVVQAAKPALGCTLLAFTFVDDDAPLTLDLPASLASIEAGGALDFVCTMDGSDLGQDNDCQDVADNNGDGVIVMHVLNATAQNGQATTVFVQQEAVEQSAPISISPETRFDPNATEDVDGDGLENSLDNCPVFPNPLQTNTDNDPVSSPGVAVPDNTAPNGDAFGDPCDEDSDNDGFANTEEYALGSSLHFLCPATTGETDPIDRDTDDDLVLDRAECALGSNPLNAASKPQPPSVDTDGDGLDDTVEAGLGSDPNDADTDDDGINDGIEFKGYNTSPTSPDTDGDGCPDNTEITSFDTNTVVNSLDLLIASISFNTTNRPNIDVNKNGVVNSSDLLLVALNFNPFPCVEPD